jgi:membrane peptidoglycan carboxypeptidase
MSKKFNPKKIQSLESLEDLEQEIDFPDSFFDIDNNSKKEDFEFQTTKEINNPLALPDDIFALPSENLNNTDEFLAEDGHFKETNSVRIIRKNSKVNSGDNSTTLEISKESLISKKQKFIGRKGVTSWSKNIDTLRKRFGFSWQTAGRKIIIIVILTSLILTVGVSGVAAVAIDMWNKTESYKDLQRRPIQSSIVYARDGKTKIFEFYEEEKREVIAGSEIPLVMKSAVLALEDENFYENIEKDSVTNGVGIPWKNLAGATFKCFVTAGDDCRGASGISQQLVKNMTDDDSQNLDRKIRELFRAMKLSYENTDPQNIIDTYLNWVPFGRNAYGIQEASRAYLGKPINSKDANGEFDLTIPEACYLASIINRPGYYQEAINNLPEANKFIISEELKTLNENSSSSSSVQFVESQVVPAVEEKVIPLAAKILEIRKNECLKKLEEKELRVYQKDANNKIVLNTEGKPILTPGKVIETKEQLNTLKIQEVAVTTDSVAAVELRKQNKTVFVNTVLDDPFPHFREYISKEILKVVDEKALYRNGYEIVTTIDPKIQRDVEGIIKAREEQLKGLGADNASAMVLDGPSGQILAMIGSLDYNRAEIDGKVNVATTAQQPGSSIKPYVYMSAFANGFNPGNILADVRTSWNGGSYKPDNFDRTFRGPVTMRRALQGSLNIPAVKSLFLTNNDPNWDQTSKLNSFYNFSEKLGLRFPCVEGAYNATFPDEVEVCTADPAAGITQDMVDKAYRGRCGIASSLGGCEITMVSHATAMNTIMQEGRLRTSTPFISIKEKQTGRDIYDLKQKSPNPPFPYRNPDASKPEELEEILLARQMENVMSDYEARIPEFGSLRFNLQLNDYGGRVAAKTGTTNGPTDFWTIGGSPYNTVSLWVGRTDNKNMTPEGSAGASAALVWKDIMEYMHIGKEAKSFSTEGLIPTWVSGGTVLKPGAKDAKDPKNIQSISGSLELLTPNQTKQLRSGVVALNDPKQVEDVTKKDIFANRSATVPATYSINSEDGKLFVEGKTLAANKKDVQCNILVGEFPQSPEWNDSIVKLASTSKDFCKLPEPSTTNTKEEEPEIVTNLVDNSINSITKIEVSVIFPTNSTKTIKSIDILQNGTVIQTNKVSNTSVTANIPADGVYNFTIQVVDSDNTLYSKLISQVSFKSTEKPTTLIGDDVVIMSCLGLKISVAHKCSLQILDDKKTYNSISIKINNDIGTCTSIGNTLNCSITATTAGTYPVILIIDGKSYTKEDTVVS